MIERFEFGGEKNYPPKKTPVCSIGEVTVGQENNAFVFYVLGIHSPQIFSDIKVWNRAIVGYIDPSQESGYSWYGPSPEEASKWIGEKPKPRVENEDEFMPDCPFEGLTWRDERQPLCRIAGRDLHILNSIKLPGESAEDVKRNYGLPLFATADQLYVSFSELLSKKTKEHLLYQDLLLTTEWGSRRLEILLRDMFICTRCKKRGAISDYNDSLTAGIMPAIHPNGSIIGYYVDLLSRGVPQFGIEKVVLQVHHKKYILGRWPWNYSDRDLITLCDFCHEKVHNEEEILYCNEQGNELPLIQFTPCLRCSGRGYISDYKHIQNGICFRCWGARFEEVLNGLKKKIS